MRLRPDGKEYTMEEKAEILDGLFAHTEECMICRNALMSIALHGWKLFAEEFINKRK